MKNQTINTCVKYTFNSKLIESYIAITSFQTSTAYFKVLCKNRIDFNDFTCNFNHIFGSNISNFQISRTISKARQEIIELLNYFQLYVMSTLYPVLI